MTEVSGTITCDGVPVPEGVVQFRNAEGEPRCYEGTITNGTYRMTCEAGMVRVEILGFRNVPGKTTNVNGTPEPLREMFIPKKYNQQTTLSAEIKRSGNENVSFELTTR